MTLLSLQRIRSLYTHLRDECVERSRRTSELDETLATLTKAIERERERTLTDIEAALEQTLTLARTEHDDTLRKLDERLATDRAACRRKAMLDEATINERAENSEQSIRKQYQEANWTAETVYEATEPQPLKLFEQTRVLVKRMLNEITAREAQAAALARRYRQRARTASNEPPPAESATRRGDPRFVVDEKSRDIETSLVKLQRMKLPRFYIGPIPVMLFLVPPAATAAGIGLQRGWAPDAILLGSTSGAAILTIALMMWMWFVARGRVRRVLTEMSGAALAARTAAELVMAQAAAERETQAEQLIATRDREIRAARDAHAPQLERVRTRRTKLVGQIQLRRDERVERLESDHRRDRHMAETDCNGCVAAAHAKHESDTAAAEECYEQTTSAASDAHEAGHGEVDSAWRLCVGHTTDELADVTRNCTRLFPAWNDPRWQDWTPGTTFAPVIQFGSLRVDLAALEGGPAADDPTLPDELRRFRLPAVLDLSGRASLLLEGPSDTRLQMVETLQTVMMRLLTTMPPGKVRFTILDPVGLGQNFAGFMHLADYDDQAVGGKIWTETRHFEQRLTDLTEHMETVIQKYLRNEFETIAEYNEQAGEIAEPYRFLVVCNFPVNFSEQAIRRFAAILSSGPRCGVHTLISMADDQPLPRGLERDDLARSCSMIAYEDGRFVWRDPDFATLPLRLDQPPTEAWVTTRLHEVGRSSHESSRVEVPFDVVAPPMDELWTSRSDEEVRIPLGRAGATKLQHLALGRGTNQHALVAGKTGSGKSTLLHVLITNLALLYSPDEMELYLVDFKKGVEFKTYVTHGLPHARAIAIESDREFGVSVLQRLDTELKRRGAAFRDLGAQSIGDFRRLKPDVSMPRVLLIIDEFQEFFVQDDRISQEAALLLDRLVRQGRAFGVHVLLGSQTLGGAYSLARSTLGQMGVRIALQCAESDSFLILSDDNAAARLLSRPGEAIYNDANGNVEGNSPFQVVWLSEQTRERYLGHVRGLVKTLPRRIEPPIVFEGNVPADIGANQRLREALSDPTTDGAVRGLRLWLGEPVAIKDPTSTLLTRRSGSNVLVVGQGEEAAMALAIAGLVGLAAQSPDASFYILDGTLDESPHTGLLPELARNLHRATHLSTWRDADEMVSTLSVELARRSRDRDVNQPAIIVLIHGLQRFRDLRSAGDYGFYTSTDDAAPAKPGQQFTDLLRDGPACGIHVIAWVDTNTNFERVLERQMLREFDHRILFQMSSTDSTNLIESPVASTLGLHRAMCYSDVQATAEKFRPYGMPSKEWLAGAMKQLAAAPTVR